MDCEGSRGFGICLRVCDLIREPERETFGVTDASGPDLEQVPGRSRLALREGAWKTARAESQRQLPFGIPEPAARLPLLSYAALLQAPDCRRLNLRQAAFKRESRSIFPMNSRQLPRSRVLSCGSPVRARLPAAA